MKAKELKDLSKDELKQKLAELHKTQMELDFKRNISVEKPHLFKQTKRNIARILTVLNGK